MTVLKKKELEASPLADLHAIASELGLEGFRSKRKNELIAAILEVSGDPRLPPTEGHQPDEAPADQALELDEVPADEVLEPDEVPADEVLEPPAAVREDGAAEDEAETSDTPRRGRRRAPPSTSRTRRKGLLGGHLGGRARRARSGARGGALQRRARLLANGSGFVRVDPAGQSRDDVCDSPARSAAVS